MDINIDDFETVWTTSDSTNLAVATSTTYFTKGSYSMQVSGTTASSGATLTKDLGSSRLLDLNQCDYIGFYIKSNIVAAPGSGNTGTTVFLKFGFSNDDITYTEYQVPINQTAYSEQVIFNISDVAKDSRNDVRYFKFTVVDQSRAFVLYLDEIVAFKPELFYDVDKAIKSRLENLNLDGQPVKVRFNVPEKIEELIFPSVSVSVADIYPDYSREYESHEVNYNYTATGVSVYRTSKAWNILYDIVIFTDKMSHDRSLQEQILTQFPARDAYLTIRGQQHPITYEGYVELDDLTEERIFSKAFSYEVETRAGDTFLQNDKLVLTVVRDYYDIDGDLMV